MTAPTAPSVRPGPTGPGSRPAGEGTDPLDQPQPARPRDFGIDVARLRRLRRITFAILALPLLVLALLALRFVSMPLTQAWSGAAYHDHAYARASDRLAPVETVNWFEPYLPHLTRGTDLLQQGDDAAAEKELRVALKDWQHGHDLNKPAHAQCKILNNLAISIERQADAMKDPAARGDRLHEAEQLLAPCGGGGGGQGNENRQTTGDNGKRIEDKRKQADKESGTERPQDPSQSPGTPPPSPSQNPSNSPRRADPSGTQPPEEAPTPSNGPEQSKQDQLEQRNKDANQGGGGDPSQSGSTPSPQKPW